MPNLKPKDCFAYRGKKCEILKEQKCLFCGFFKTVEEYAQLRLKYLEKECAFLGLSEYERTKRKLKLRDMLDGERGYIDDEEE